MVRADLRQAFKKPSTYVGISLAIVALFIVGGFIASQNNTTKQQSSQQSDERNQETAYENVIKDCLNVYHSRYSKYPKDYQTLLDDITKSEGIYGVNSEGMDELNGISDRLEGFSYTKVSDSSYHFTYQEAISGETISVTNK
jgi:predicted TIM-barrel enzyme